MYTCSHYSETINHLILVDYKIVLQIVLFQLLYFHKINSDHFSLKEFSPHSFYISLRLILFTTAHVSLSAADLKANQ